MGGFLSRLITEVEMGRPHIVAPDVGTAAALFSAAEHPEQIARLIVGAGGCGSPSTRRAARVVGARPGPGQAPNLHAVPRLTR
jgi:pimeloyl-ACP methyl ester carboxylesterase